MDLGEYRKHAKETLLAYTAGWNETMMASLVEVMIGVPLSECYGYENVETLIIAAGSMIFQQAGGHTYMVDQDHSIQGVIRHDLFQMYDEATDVPIEDQLERVKALVEDDPPGFYEDTLTDFNLQLIDAVSEVLGEQYTFFLREELMRVA